MIIYTSKDKSYGIIIRGMKMPKTCNDCWIASDYGDYFICQASGIKFNCSVKSLKERPKDDCLLENIDFENYSYCPFCGGNLSSMRYQNNHYYQHCFSCHFEFQVDIDKRNELE